MRRDSPTYQVLVGAGGQLLAHALQLLLQPLTLGPASLQLLGVLREGLALLLEALPTVVELLLHLAQLGLQPLQRLVLRVGQLADLEGLPLLGERLVPLGLCLPTPCNPEDYIAAFP